MCEPRDRLTALMVSVHIYSLYASDLVFFLCIWKPRERFVFRIFCMKRETISRTEFQAYVFPVCNWFQTYFQFFFSIMNTRRFNNLQRYSANGYFDALEYAFQCCESIENSNSTTIYDQNHSYEFLINDENHTALYLKCVMCMSKYNFLKFVIVFYFSLLIFFDFLLFSRSA